MIESGCYRFVKMGCRHRNPLVAHCIAALADYAVAAVGDVEAVAVDHRFAVERLENRPERDHQAFA